MNANFYSFYSHLQSFFNWFEAQIFLRLSFLLGYIISVSYPVSWALNFFISPNIFGKFLIAFTIFINLILYLIT